jgi:hypothetical protein
MLVISYRKVVAKSATWLSLGALLTALPLSMAASTVTVDFGILLNGINGTGQFSYDSVTADQGSDSGGNFVESGEGLDSLSLTYNNPTPYTDTSSNLLGGPALPSVFLPGNITNDATGLQYGFLSLWAVSGTCTAATPTGTIAAGNWADTISCSSPSTILGLGRTSMGANDEAFLGENVSTIYLSDGGGSYVNYILVGPGVSQIVGSITSESVVTPEPSFLTLTALGLAGLWFVRRRKVVL